MQSKIQKKRSRQANPNIKKHGYMWKFVLTVVGLLIIVGYCIVSPWLKEVLGPPPPSRAQLIKNDRTEVERLSTAALHPAMIALRQYTKSYTGLVDNSIVDLCYYSANYAGFSTTGYDKGCYQRVTALYPLQGSSYADAVSRFSNQYHVGQTDSPVRSSNDENCTYFMMDRPGDDIQADVYFCPIGRLPHPISFHRERVGANMLNQIRGPLDDDGTDGNGGPNYTLINKHLYDLQDAAQLASQKSKIGYVIIGVTNQYYLKEID